MRFIGCGRPAAIALLDRIAEHVPGDEPAGQPTLIIGSSVMITATDERFAVEVDTETGKDFVTRVRVTQPGTSELTIWQNGQELTRRTEPIAETGE